MQHVSRSSIRIFTTHNSFWDSSRSAKSRWTSSVCGRNELGDGFYSLPFFPPPAKKGQRDLAPFFTVVCVFRFANKSRPITITPRGTSKRDCEIPASARLWAGIIRYSFRYSRYSASVHGRSRDARKMENSNNSMSIILIEIF